VDEYETPPPSKVQVFAEQCGVFGLYGVAGCHGDVAIEGDEACPHVTDLFGADGDGAVFAHEASVVGVEPHQRVDVAIVERFLNLAVQGGWCHGRVRAGR
jgi:hypothetical protein